ncbi:MAG: hypothetical protein E6I85_09800 [Chloroflexi bacterium]|nr:MAG: hypothetical protein E6I85_09800 [Chloroflexota bacterium]
MEHIRAQEDFDAARAQAFRRAIVPTLTRRFRGMLSMDKVLKAAGAEGRADRGEQEIPLVRIVGSAASQGKASDFDPGFLPVSNRTRDRWTRIYREMAEGGELPPIDVYKLGDNYYVIDGHHRVSVARQLGWDTIKARVVEVQTRAPLGPDVDAEALLRAAEYAGFLEATQLDRVRPGARIQCSRLGRYDEIYQHILGHRYFLGLERGQEVPLPEAAASWYDNVYLPIVDVIRKHRVAEVHPGWTEADLYVEITRRWLALGRAGATADPHAALHELLADSRSWTDRRGRLKIE